MGVRYCHLTLYFLLIDCVFLFTQVVIDSMVVELMHQEKHVGVAQVLIEP